MTFWLKSDVRLVYKSYIKTMEYNLLFDAYYLWSFTDKNERLMEIVLLIIRKLEPKAHALTMLWVNYI